ncbi:hypothetical protein MMYC01_209320 [Madurella mycetomatis]|uniref:Protein kinase domain-containing protein n=1 Tax=Madurella mycetomatis TaxID=100816 RepID=A0A175VUR2_9PEZI|nr:hypothetical protein MMYC01_209320 [Madurella mycetomatis]
MPPLGPTGNPAKPLYSFHKPLPNNRNLFLVRRTTDGEPFLTQPLDHTSTDTDGGPDPDPNTHALYELIVRGAGHAAANVPNHENFVSLHDELVSFPLRSGSGGSTPTATTATVTAAATAAAEIAGLGGDTGGRKRTILLWDWCDAGTLQDVFDKPPVVVPESAAEGFLPESFVWHVALGLPRALCWLHARVREGYDVVGDGDGDCGRCKRGEECASAAAEGGRDVWRREAWGFERCFVSGTVSYSDETLLVAMKSEAIPLGTLRESGPVEEGWSQRPYTQGSELFALGAILYRMMCGRQLPPAEECISCGCRHITHSDDPEPTACPHTCFEDVNTNEIFTSLSCYTQELKGVVIILLRANRTELTANEMLDLAWSGFEK